MCVTDNILSPLLKYKERSWYKRQKTKKMYFLNPKKALGLGRGWRVGGRGQFEPPCCFPKNASSKERVKPKFFVTFVIIISHIFPKNLIEIPQLFLKIIKAFSVNISYFHRFSSIFWIFWPFLATKKLMTSAYNRWWHYTFSLLTYFK